ncbi:FimV/HubP family polar landmark protein [Shewanella glacialipiscicola]|uniref:Pilus assembly protein FimV n=3 Tax=Shewanella glacialipiscicola TaxID=614069 RepID=A0ABQ6J3G4_9GAMM|nr:FimV/HubP family polar landmark protein [Shewanella glacialipiscicola]GIU07009.1 pilus assembly protein FimV [Shewanella glacialipiscicola]GMA82620.1 pilus assembly protein FimV [Shewanella glacialipiscicola]
MTFRTSYLVGLMATVLAVSSITYFVDPAIAADTSRLKPLKIMGPDGQIRQVNHQYGPTTSKDTFWSIAQKVRPDASVSVYQVMAALYDANPHAFNSASYNSLERGMILLIPSKDVMQSIPNRLAIARAEQSDKPSRAAKNTAKPAAKVTMVKAPVVAPVTVPTVVAEKVVTPQTTAPAPVVADTKAADTSVAPVPAVDTQVQATPKMVSSDNTARLEAAESKNLSLTDELARTQDQLAVRNSDVEALKVKVEELNQRIAVLEETLQASKLQNQALKTEVEAAQISDPTDAQADIEPPAEPDDLWRNFLNNPMLMVAAAVIPALLLLLGVFWLLRRKRNKERREMQAQQAAMAAGAAATTLSMDNDNLDDMAVHLDRDPIDSIDSLLDMGSIDLQPEHDLSDASDQMDMASEMFIDQSVAVESEVEEEGQSLDDLWAEAMGDQEADIPEDKPKSGNILEEADLDALLAGLDAEETSKDNLSELERNFGNDLAQTNDVSFEQNNDVEIDASQSAKASAADTDDLDALLAEFSAPIAKTASESVVVDDLSDTLSNSAVESDNDVAMTSNDDIDALLADFDKPTPAYEPESESEPEIPEPDLSAEIAAELDAELDALGVDDTDDIDALLADFDKPTPAYVPEPEITEPDLSAEIAAELDAELNAFGVADTDDIDALLADFDKPTPISVPESEPEITEPDFSAEIAAELDAELDALGVDDTDDIDALLADFDKPTPAYVPEPEITEPDFSAEIAAELDAELDDLGVDNSDDIDSLLASFETKPEIDLDTTAEFQNSVQDGSQNVTQHDVTDDVKESIDNEINAVIAAELQASLPEDLTDEEDLDALLAQFELPEQSEADADEINFDLETAEITPTDTDDTDDLLKGIGAGHDLNGTDDTFELDDEPQVSLTTTGVAAATAAALIIAKDKESSFFNDLKANKNPDPHVLDWDSELDFAPKVNPVTPPTDIEDNDVELKIDAITQTTEEKPIKATRNDLDFSEDFKLDTQKEPDELDFEQGFDLSDDNVLAAFTANVDFDEDEDVLTSEDSFSLIDDHNLTVDEALAALDAQESRKAQQRFVPEHDLTHFQNENGFIDIDKLLNDANEEGSDTDQYSEIDVEMSDVDALIGDAAMIDVDDEENSVSAKLDLARAYIEIDDSDSAKALLKEVNIDGNARQQEEAQRLLKDIT